MNTNKINESEQEVLNQSFDPKYKTLAVELLAENPDGTATVRLKTDADGKLEVTGGSSTPIDTSALATHAKQDAIITELQKKVDATEAQLVQQDNYMRVLSQILARPIYFNPATGALKVDSHAVTLSSTNVTTLTNFGTLAADVMARNTSINTWANTARRTIS